MKSKLLPFGRILVLTMIILNKSKSMSKDNGIYNMERGAGEAGACKMKHSCHLNTAKPEKILKIAREKNLVIKCD